MESESVTLQEFLEVLELIDASLAGSLELLMAADQSYSEWDIEHREHIKSVLADYNHPEREPPIPDAARDVEQSLRRISNYRASLFSAVSLLRLGLQTCNGSLAIRGIVAFAPRPPTGTDGLKDGFALLEDLDEAKRRLVLVAAQGAQAAQCVVVAQNVAAGTIALREALWQDWLRKVVTVPLETLKKAVSDIARAEAREKVLEAAIAVVLQSLRQAPELASPAAKVVTIALDLKKAIEEAEQPRRRNDVDELFYLRRQLANAAEKGEQLLDEIRALSAELVNTPMRWDPPT